ncbi:hypothetical protein GE061_009170 [Apolygus lucorum]|uniref:THAP-type domain-containing protein n=1 Tax=Apolygus lucorum TaxID=248454 RepID=A0A8S9XZR9_APOLU|nr:hypothetical protein GE061_009170 [Apolygus lucorum]
MINMYEMLVKRDEVLMYLPMYKVSQDHLERLFGYIRRRGGNNDNPSALEFCHLFRKIIVHKQLHESNARSGNAIPLDKIDLLGISFGRNLPCEELINSSTRKSSMLDFEEPEVDEECPELQDDVFSDLILDIVEYIAGYVVRGMGRKIMCEECLLAIADEENCPLNLTSNLISMKNRGGLIQPSSDVARICKISEKIFRMAVLKPQINSNLSHYTRILVSHCSNMNIFVDSAHLSIGGEDNHKNWLIESIGKAYFTIRIKNHLRDQNQKIEEQRVRQKLKKIIHFKGQ